jgi:hypothetical protein
VASLLAAPPEDDRRQAFLRRFLWVDQHGG